MEDKTAANIALLAPVPRVHLRSALKAATPDRLIAFGTKAWETFNQLDRERKGLPVDVYIYESHPDGGFEGRATWHAKYIRLEPDRYKAQPYRPESTVTDTFEGEVYWLVAELQEMKPSEHIPVVDFIGFNKRKPYGKSFAPHRPLLVEHPT